MGPRLVVPDRPASRVSDAEALQAYLALCTAWGLNAATTRRLLGRPKSTFFRWVGEPAGAHLTPIERKFIQHLVNIQLDLVATLGSVEAAGAWIHNANDRFAPNPLHYMLDNQYDGAVRIRQYLGGLE